MTTKEETVELLEQEFLEKYSELINKGLVFNGIRVNEFVFPPEWKISVQHPFLFDHRKIPNNFKGIKVERSTSVSLEELPFDHRAYYPQTFFDYEENPFGKIPFEEIYHPDKYLKLLNDYREDYLRVLNAPSLTDQDILDIMSFDGDFEAHRVKCEKIISDKHKGLLNSRHFSALFKEFIHTTFNNEEHYLTKKSKDIWENNTKWTRSIIGSPTNTCSESPLGDFISKNYPILQYCKEEKSIDLVFNSLYREGHHTRIQDMSMNEDSFVDSPEYLPKQYSILVEHENQIELCYEEMVKLTQFKARLKVLVTYVPDGLDDVEISRTKEIAKNNFANIIKESNLVYSENEETEYLLLVGVKHEVDKDIEYLKWESLTLNTKGNIV